MRLLLRMCVGVYLVIALAIALPATADSLDFIQMTLQGRLSDENGQPVPDGSYNIPIQILGQGGINNWGTSASVTTVNGLYSVVIENVPISAFVCDDGSITCEQDFLIELLGQGITLPSIAVGQAGRAGVASRLNGDIETSPSRIDFPASDELQPQTSSMTDGGFEFIGVNGTPTLKFANFLGPGQPLPTLDIADPTLTTFGGPTTVHDAFTVNIANDATPDFQVNNIVGVHSVEQIVSFQPTATSRFEMQFDGDIFLNSYSSGVQDLADFELLNGGGAALRSTSLAIDRNNDNSPDVHFQSNGDCTFNSDLSGGADVTFGSTNCTFSKPLRCDPDGDGSNQYLFEASQCTFNPDEDANPEFICDGGTVTVQAGFIVDLNPSVFGETFVAGVGTVFADANMDGTRELKVDANKVATNGVVEAKFNAASANTSFALEENRARFDVNQNGTNELEVGYNDVTAEEYVAVGSEFSALGKSFLLGGVRVEGGLEAFGASTFNSGVVINGDLTVTGTKNFAQAHPTDPTKEIVYVALEAGESGTYTRGSGQLTNGTAVIEFPEHFVLVTDVDGLTAQITPRGPVRSMLYVESVTRSRLVVRASSLIDGEVRFDYMVNGVRAGFEDHQVIRVKRTLASR